MIDRLPDLPDLPDSHLRLRVPMVLSGKASGLAALYDGAVRAHPEMPLEPLSSFRTLQAGALDRGVPAMALVTMPKSGSLYLRMRFVEGLNIPPCHVSLDLFPHDHLVPAWAEDLARGGAIAQEHLDASEAILDLFHRAGVTRIVVHIRDPRQAALSWMYHIDGTTGERTSVRRLMSPAVPADWKAIELGDRLDWTIANHLPALIEWTAGWVRAAGRGSPPLEIMVTRFEDFRMVTRFEDFRTGEDAFCRSILDHYGIGDMAMNMHPLASSDGALDRRKGEADEWRSVFSAAQLARTSAMLPADLCKRFGWAPL